MAGLEQLARSIAKNSSLSSLTLDLKVDDPSLSSSVLEPALKFFQQNNSLREFNLNI